jgi:hypothetical protein
MLGKYIRSERALGGTYSMESLVSIELSSRMAVQLEANIQQLELMAAKAIRDFGHKGGKVEIDFCCMLSAAKQ